MIKILIIDDEEAACNILAILIGKYMPLAHQIKDRAGSCKSLATPE